MRVDIVRVCVRAVDSKVDGLYPGILAASSCHQHLHADVRNKGAGSDAVAREMHPEIDASTSTRVRNDSIDCPSKY